MIGNPASGDRAIEAALTFLVPSGERPMVRMPAGHADRIERTDSYEAVPVTINDARHLSEPPTIDQQGFALVCCPTAVTDFFDPALVERVYYPEIIDLLERCTGANEVCIFDHTVRLEDEASAQGAGLRQPVAFVHNDYTERSAPKRVRDFFSPQEAARLAAGRVVFVNAWRSIGASAERYPLAAADGRSLSPPDYVAVDMVYADRMGEIYHCTYAPGQRWFYFSGMRTDEVMLLKCFDSATDGRTRYTAHTGFANPHAAPGTPPRRSIETRAMLFFAD